ncbi:unnamed protein product [Miscanthus lutarioriparius]|uniref:BTB domain-containing protein n=1 Tax=Miscanthus lutarioriparius TaxID=422564 RepID=A0A811RCN0_9POAL|nr:unnamed protein product [Miscanthus lutarioriparius]
MKHKCTHLIEDVCVSSVHRLKVDGFSVTKSTIRNKNDCLIKSRCRVDRGRVRDDVQASSHLIKGGSFTVECMINVHSRRDPNSASLSSSDLHQHLGKLLENQSGVDVTFVVSGESISAHKSILAARSPIFMAEFFGNMLERSSQCVEIQDMHPTVFKAMLHYIYTDTVPELDNNDKIRNQLRPMRKRQAQDNLRGRLTLDIGIGTVASTLALAEQHSFSQLKAKCIDFISGGSSKNLKAVLETEGYRYLEASNPSLLTELLKAAHGKKRKQFMGGVC